MGYWLKKLTNNTEIRGEDSEIDRGLISWSRSECYLLSAIVNRGYELRLAGLGQYWQSDTYEATSNGDISLIKTRLEKQISENDLVYSISNNRNCTSIMITNQIKTSLPLKAIPKGMVGKWFILEYDLVTKSVKTYFSSEKI